MAFCGTIVGAFFAILFVLQHFMQTPSYDFSLAGIAMVFAATALMVLSMSCYLITARAVLKEERYAIPAAFKLYMADISLRGAVVGIVAYFLYTLFLDMLPQFNRFLDKWQGIALWLFLTGGAIDLLRLQARRGMRFASPTMVAKFLDKAFVRSLRHQDEVGAMAFFDSCNAGVVRAAKEGSLDVALAAFGAQVSMVEHFVGTSAMRSLMAKDGAEGASLLDRVGYFVAYVCRRSFWAYEAILRAKEEPMAEEQVAFLGRVALVLARYHPSLINVPLNALGQVAERALDHKMEVAAERTILTLAEICKALTRESLRTGQPCRESFQTALSILERLVKESFKRNKTSPIALLMQPFAEIANALGSSDMDALPDRDHFLSELRRILGELNALEAVMQGVSEMSTIEPYATPGS